MPNMSYCRFQNTVSDVADCLDNLHNNLSPDEHEARQRLIELAEQILAEKERWMLEEHDGSDSDNDA